MFHGVSASISDVNLTSKHFCRDPQAVQKGLCSHQPSPARRDAPFTEQGRSERRGDAYLVPYVEPLSDKRTKLEDFLNSLRLIVWNTRPAVKQSDAGQTGSHGKRLIWTWMTRLRISAERQTCVRQESAPPHRTEDRHLDLSRRVPHCRERLFLSSSTSAVPYTDHRNFALPSQFEWQDHRRPGHA